MREVCVSDVTMKEANSSSNLALSFKEKLEITKLLDRLGASVIEVEGISKPKVDALRIKSIATIVKSGALAVPVALDDPDNVAQVWNAAKAANRVRLQVQASVSPAQMEYLYRKKAPAMAQSIVEAVRECAKYTDDVEFIAEDATRADVAFLASTVKSAIEAGATTVTLADMAGKMLPEEFAAFVTGFKNDVPEMSGVRLGVHCSDNLFMADACAVDAIKVGVDEVKASSYPLGCVNLDKLVTILADKASVLEAQCSVHTTEIKRIGKQIAWLCESGSSKTGVLALAAEADESIALTENDSMDTVSACVTKLGYDLSAEDVVSVYEAFQRIAANKEVIGSRELDAIVATAALQVPATYKVDEYVINSGNAMRATARLKLVKDGEAIERVCMGDGPIDAAFSAIDEIAGTPYDVDDFQVRALTEGQEAMGEAIIKLNVGGKLYSGRGLSTDITAASIYAYVNAINKVVYEEQN